MRVYLRDTAGNRSSLDEQYVPDALAAGYRRETPEELASEADKATQAAEAQAQSETEARAASYYGGSDVAAQAMAGAAGLVRGVVPASDLLLTKAGVDAQALKDLEAAYPTTSTVSEVVGTAGALIGTGGALTAGKVAFAAPRAIGAVGKLAEKGAEKVLGKGLLGRVAGQGAGAAVEGAAYGANAAVNQAARDEQEITAELLGAQMLDTALVSGGIGGALPIAGWGARKVWHVAKSAVGGALDLAGTGARKAIIGTESLTAPMTGHQVGDLADVLKNENEYKAALKVTDDEVRDIAMGSRDGKVSGIAADMDEMNALQREVWDEWRGARKQANVAGKLPDSLTLDEAKSAILDVINISAKRLDEALTGADRAAYNEYRPLLRKALDDLKLRAQEIGKAQTREEAFIIGDRAKRYLQEIRYHKMKSGGSNDRLNAAIDLLDDPRAYRKFRAGEDLAEQDMPILVMFQKELENQKRWGEAARMQAEVNPRWAKKLGDDQGAGRAGAFVVDRVEDGMPVWKSDPNYWDRMLSSMDDIRGDIPYQYMRRRLKDERELTLQMAEHLGDEKLIAKARAAAEMEGSIQSRLDRLADVLPKRAHIKGMMAREGATLEGGGMAGKLLAQVVSPVRNINRTWKAQEVRRAASELIGKSSAKYVDRATTAGGRAARAMAPSAAVQVMRSIQSDPQGHRERLASLVSDPNRWAGEAASYLPDDMPIARQGSAQRAAALSSYLMTHAPKVAGQTVTPLAASKTPTGRRQAESYARRVEAVRNPMGAIADISNGAASPEAIETIKTQYPALWRALQTGVISGLGSSTKPVAPRSRDMVSSTVGIDSSAMGGPSQGFVARMAAPNEKEKQEITGGGDAAAKANQTALERIGGQQ